MRKNKLINRKQNVRRRKRKYNVIGGAADFFLLFLRTSSVHGFGQIAAKNRHPSETAVWIISVICGLYGATWLCLSTMHRFQESPTVISLERNYHEWNTTFPAATICPVTKIDAKIVGNVVNKWFQSVENKSEVANWLDNLARASYTTFGNLDELSLKSENYLDSVLDSALKFQYTLSNSNSDDGDLIKTVTEMGICYTYNSEVAIYNNPNFWKEGNWSIIKGIKIFKGNPLEGDIFAQIMDMNSGFKVYLHSPTDVAEIGSFSSRVVPPKFYLTVGLTALATYSTEETRGLSISQRKCRFLDESDLSISPAYTYKMCRIDCRRKLAMKLCGCLPYFYRNRDNLKICDAKGMKCLGNYKERLIKLANGKTKEKCQCFPPCNDVNYSILTENLAAWFLGTNLKYGLDKYPRTRFKRDVFFSFHDLLVQFGGTVGLCLGCSVLSCLELIYFFTLRLLVFLINRLKI